MNPKIPKEEKARNAGISLEPELIEAARALAKKRGVKSISGLARLLITQALQEAAGATERAAQKLERTSAALQKKGRGQKK